MLDIVQELERNGQSLQHFSRELSRYWRNLLVAKISGKPTRLIAASEPEQQGFLEVAGWFSEEDLTRYLNLTLDLYKTLQESMQPRLHLELGLIKLVQVGKLQPIEEAIAALGPPNSVQKPVAQPSVQQMTASTRAATPRPPAFQVSTKPTPPPPAAVAPATQTGNFRQALYDALCKAGLNFTADAVQRSEVSLEGAELAIRAPKTMLLALKDPSLQRVASELLAKPVRVRVEAGENLSTAPVTAPSADSGSDASLRERALSHPGVKRFQELFPDAQVRTVRNLNE